MNNRQRSAYSCFNVLSLLLLLFLLLLTRASVIAAPEAQAEPPASVTLDNGYHITFHNVTSNLDGTSTWHYGVAALPDAKKLQHWVLAIPACTTIVTATPISWEVVSPDPTTWLDGIKWETAKDFQQGEFTVTLTGHLVVGTVQVAAKGPHVAQGVIAGPSCEPLATPQPTLPALPTATNPPSPTNPPTLTATAMATPTYTPLPTMTPPAMVTATETATPLPTITTPTAPVALGLQVTKTDYMWIDADEDQEVSVGDTLLYVIKIINNNTTAVTDLLVHDSLPPATILLFGTVQTNQGLVVTGNQVGDNQAVVDMGTLASGASATLSFQVQISPQVPVAQLENQAIIIFRSVATQNDDFLSTISDDPDTAERFDPTITPMKWRDQVVYLPLIER